MPSRPKDSPKERLELTLEIPATPEHVRDIADMFADTIREIRPDLAEGDVTMVVKNFSSVAEIRGWRGEGEIAVKLLGDLVHNPTDAVQTHAELASAARTLAAHANKLTKYRPKFSRGREKPRVCGRWDEDEAGELHLAASRIVEANLDYSPWSGREILKASHDFSHLFTAEDFERMMSEIKSEDMG